MRSSLRDIWVKLSLIGLLGLGGLFSPTPTPAVASDHSVAKIYVAVFWDANGNGLHDAGEDLISGVPIVVTREDVQGQAPSLEGKSGYESLKYFLVDPGRVQVTLGEKGPLAYTWTTASTIALDVAANQEIRLTFGVAKVQPRRTEISPEQWQAGALIALWVTPVILSSAILLTCSAILRRLRKKYTPMD